MAPATKRLSDLRPSRRSLLVAMAGSVSVVLGLGLWSSGREMEVAIARLESQQAFLALAVAQDVGSRIALFRENERLSNAAGLAPSIAREAIPASVLEHLGALEREGQMLVLVRECGQRLFQTSDHRPVENQQLQEGFARHETHLVLARESAEQLQLTRHRAIAGLAEVSSPDQAAPTLQIAVLTSAAPERERVYRAQWRDALTGLTAIAIVLWFGRLTLAQQRRELELAAQLERVQLERERDAQLSRAGRFAMLAAMSTGIAHELGTPLSVMVGRLEQLAPLASVDESSARALRSMNEQTERMNGIIRGFLALARGETPILENSAPIRVVEAARELVRHRFVSADVALEVDVAEGLPQLSLDVRLFTQVVVNLLVNACDASHAGDAVSLSVRQDEEAVVFEVFDRGQGVSEEVAKRATEPFFTTRASIGGTGLGLAIANEITQQHGGTLELLHRGDGANAEPGTCARVRIPLASPRLHAELHGSLT